MIPRKNFWITLTTAVVALFLLISIAQADEPYDLTLCSSGQTSMLLATKELVLFNTQGNGITMSNHENKKFQVCHTVVLDPIKLRKVSISR
jgi:hypothetical protein